MRGGRGTVAVLVLLAVVVNLPFLHQAWQRHRLAQDGRHVTADVTATDVLRAKSDPLYVVRFRLPEEIDPARTTWPAEVDRATYERAGESRRIGVRVLPDRPSAQQVDGERTGSLGYVVIGVVIGVVDAIVVLIGLLLWGQRRRRASGEPATLER
ncbi:hypothetical protein GCM10022237_33690 [Nocardioides ginsengisoli]|uniref:DUF3592 domain-containing protein n=1 Tax=Nocardioides ginsengisoli TaxID=363868 RepID=A0ABW3VYY7_9ACTN